MISALIFSFCLVMMISGIQSFRSRMKPYTPLEVFTLYIDKRIPALMSRYDIPGVSISLVKAGKIVWFGAYGYADVESGRMLTPDTPMRVQSISKSVTAWAIMQLVEQGKIDLDQPAVQYLKSWRFPASDFSTDEVTVRQLLSHTSGLPLGDVFTIYSPGDDMPSLRDKLTQEALPVMEPAAAFSYSNTGYNLLELLIEDVTGQDFATYMHREVLLQIGMERSSYHWSSNLEPPVPNGYDLNGKPVPVYVYPEKGSGGLFATANDIADFVVAEMSAVSNKSRVLSSRSIEALHTPEAKNLGVYSLVFDAYGLGHYIETLPNGMKAVAHGGQGTGIMTHYHAVPETGDAIVILTNSQRSWPFIAYLLSDWAQWSGFPSVGMGRIIWGEFGIWAVTGLILVVVFLQTSHLIAGIVSGSRKAVLCVKRFRLKPFIQATSAIILFALLVWCLFQRYLFITSVFPVASRWLGFTAFALSGILLFSALFPTNQIELIDKRKPRDTKKQEMLRNII
jgi:CubicO group peptidase (beta-lactamase class C family)